MSALSNDMISSSASVKPLFSFGAIADIQYADADDGSDFKKTVVRRYRNTLRILHEAVNLWMNQEQRLGYPVELIAQLGDIIDGRCRERDGGTHYTCLARVMEEFNRMRIPRLDIIGNHELYNFSREELLDVEKGPLNSARNDDPILQGKASSWYSYQPKPGIRFIVVDAYDISMLNGTSEESTIEARAFLNKKNPNNFEEKGVDWTQGLSGKSQRFVPYNGAIGKNQLSWLRETLLTALASNEKCIILSHVSLIPGACSISCVVWNYEEVLRILHNPGRTIEDGSTTSAEESGDDEFGPTPVICCLYGHAHKGGYRMDRRGIHHITLQAPLEAVGDEMAHATIDLMEDHLVIHGEGRVTSYEKLKYPCHCVDEIDRNHGCIDEITLAKFMHEAHMSDKAAALDLLMAHDGILSEAQKCVGSNL